MNTMQYNEYKYNEYNAIRIQYTEYNEYNTMQYNEYNAIQIQCNTNTMQYKYNAIPIQCNTNTILLYKYNILNTMQCNIMQYN